MTINDFNRNMPVSPSLGDLFTVRVGEPQSDPNVTGAYVLPPANARLLDRTVESPVPAWGANIDLKFQQAACLEVLEDTPGANATLTCKAVAPAATSVDIAGFRLDALLLAEVLKAIGDPQYNFANGLVVGIMYDENLVPLSNHKVTVPPGVTATIDYVNSTFTGTNLNFSSSNGIFISRDAPFGTVFSIPNNLNATPSSITALGGLVEGKVTLVVLQQTKAPMTQ